MYETMRFLRLFAGFVGVGLTAAALTVTTAYAEPHPGAVAVVDVSFQRQGQLDPGESVHHRFTLDAGMTYRFSATCDVDCSDVDLILRDLDGNEVAADEDSDDSPSIAYSPRRGGVFRLEVRMYSCAAAWCGYTLAGTAW